MEELKKELEELKRKLFMLNMVDSWDNEDYRISNEWHTRILEIEKELKNYVC